MLFTYVLCVTYCELYFISLLEHDVGHN